MCVLPWAPQSILGHEQWSTGDCQDGNKQVLADFTSACRGSAAGLLSLSLAFKHCGEAGPLASNFEKW